MHDSRWQVVRGGIMIQIENLSLTLQKIDILKDINLNLENGKIHGLIGRNGC